MVKEKRRIKSSNVSTQLGSFVIKNDNTKRRICRLAIETSSLQCRSRLPPLSGWSWLATIAELMGLIRLFSLVSSAGSMDPARNHPCSTGTLRLLPDPVAHIPRTHSTGPPGSIHFMPFTRQGHKSLSFILSPSLPMYAISICLMCAVPFAVPVMSISVRRCFVCISSLRSSFHISSFPSFFLVPSVPPLSHLSLLPPYLSLPAPPPPPHLFTRRLFFFPPNPQTCFIGAAFNSLPTHFSWLRCSTTFKCNMDSVMQKHYRT